MGGLHCLLHPLLLRQGLQLCGAMVGWALQMWGALHGDSSPGEQKTPSPQGKPNCPPYQHQTCVLDLMHAVLFKLSLIWLFPKTEPP